MQQLTKMTSNSQMFSSGSESTSPSYETRPAIGFGELLSEKRRNTTSTQQNKNDLESTSVQSLCGPGDSGFEELSSANENTRFSEQQRQNESEPLSDQLQDSHETSGFGEFSSEIVTSSLAEQEGDINVESSSHQLNDNLVKSRSRDLPSENETNTSSGQHNGSVSTLSFDQNQFGPFNSRSWKLSPEKDTDTLGVQQKESTLVTSYSPVPAGFEEPLSENKKISISSQTTVPLSNHLEDGPVTSPENWTNSLNEQLKENGACPSPDQPQDNPVRSEFLESSSERGTCDSLVSSGQHQPSFVASAHSTNNIHITLVNSSDSDSSTSSGKDQSSPETSAHNTIDIQTTIINLSGTDSTASSGHQLSSSDTSAHSTIDRPSTVINGSHTEYTYPQDEAVNVEDNTEVISTLTTNPSRLQPSCYLHADSLQVSISSTGTHLLASLLKRSENVDCGLLDVRDIVCRLTNHDWHTHHASLREALLLDRLPTALETLNMADAAECLMVYDTDVQDRAVSCLEHIRLENRHGYKSAQDLSKVMTAIIATIHCNHGNHARLLHNIHLFLLAACALLLPDRRSPSELQESVTLVQEKLCNTLKDCETQGSKTILRKLEEISQIFSDMIKAVLPDGSRHTRVKWTKQMFLKLTDKELKKANMGYLVMCFHSLVMEICKVGWSPTIPKLTLKVNRILEEVSRRKLEEISRLTFDLFGLRCLASVLNTAFNEDRQNVQGRTSDSPKMLVTLVNQIVLKSSQKKTLLEELTLLHFHPCGVVRLMIRDLMTRCNLQLAETILKYIDTRVRLAGIQVCYDLDLSSQNKTKQDQQTSCKWIEKKCMDNSGVKLLVAFYLPKQSCLGRGAIMKCIQKHSGKHQHNQLHENNLELLQSIKAHPGFLTLFAFQIHPMPSFYITEDVSESRLLHLLLDRRGTQKWLPSNILCQAALDVISALEFLDGQRIVLRDITTYNMAYNLQERQTSQAQKDVMSVQVKIANLGLANRCCSERANRNIVRSTVIDAGPVPTRWTSVEALCYGEFSSKSMAYSLGYVLYELFTHGCQPFSEMQGRSTEDILKLVVTTPEVTRPFRWPCFPPDMFDLIRTCTTQVIEDRPSLPQIKEKLKECFQSQTSCKLRVDIPSLKHQWRMMQSYPLLDTKQTERNHVPETGIPSCIRKLINGDPKHKKVLPTDRKLQKRQKDNDTSSDLLTIHQENDELTSVHEVLTPSFVKSFLPLLETSVLEGVMSWTDTRIFPQPDHFTQERHYEPSVPLAEVARMRLEAPDGEEEQNMFIHTFLAITKCVCNLHENSWLHRDLRAANILITRHTGKVILARIGRMVHLPEAAFIGEEEVDVSGSLRWLSPEALHFNVYTKENDIFMLGTTFWETYNIRHVCSRNPAATKSDLVPFPDNTKAEVMRFTQEGVQPFKLPNMPQWLYKLVVDCRHPDTEKRPTISDVITRLQEHCLPLRGKQNIMSFATSLPVNNSSSCRGLKTPDRSDMSYLPRVGGTKSIKFKFFPLGRKRTKCTKGITPPTEDSFKYSQAHHGYENDLYCYSVGTPLCVSFVPKTYLQNEDDSVVYNEPNEVKFLPVNNHEMSKTLTSAPQKNSKDRGYFARESRPLPPLPDENVSKKITDSKNKENTFEYREQCSYSKATQTHNKDTTDKKSETVPLQQDVHAKMTVIKHRQEHQLFSLPPPHSEFERKDDDDDDLLNNYAQRYHEKENCRVSSFGDQVSPLHRKNTSGWRCKVKERKNIKDASASLSVSRHDDHTDHDDHDDNEDHEDYADHDDHDDHDDNDDHDDHADLDDQEDHDDTSSYGGRHGYLTPIWCDEDVSSSPCIPSKENIPQSTSDKSEADRESEIFV